MSTFQEFGPLSERRRAELSQKRRKKMMMAGASLSLLLIVAVVGVAAVSYREEDGPAEDNSKSNTRTGSAVQSVSKSVSLICTPTDYKQACEESLNRAAANMSGKASTKDLVKAAVSAVSREIGQAFGRVDALKTDDPRIKGAVEVCGRVFADAKDELRDTLDAIGAHDLRDLPKKSPQLRTWLSAVMSYQAACVDAFPDGDLKNEMNEGMKMSKELTSNALAIIGKASSFLADSKGSGSANRRLLSEEEEEEEKKKPELHEDGTPSWIDGEERRLLRGKASANLEPDITVAQDGSGQFKTINAALAAMPQKYTGRYTIYVKAGTYNEYVEVTKKMVNVTMFGDGSRKTIITGSKNYIDGVKTFMTASFAAIGDGFIGIGLGFRNTAGPEKHQAVALRVQSDRSVFLNCRFEGYQDTLYAQTHRQYYRSCVILGTVDFIFGDAAAVFQNCIMQVLRPLDGQFNAVTAHGRVDRHESTGFVLHDCKIQADPSLEKDKAKIKSYLGRPWKIASRVVTMESEIGDFISPEGYTPWEPGLDLGTLLYGEYNNKGGGASTAKRVSWKGFKVIKSKQEAVGYTVAEFIQGAEWIKKAGAPVRLGLYN